MAAILTPTAFDVEHRSLEWRELRCGYITASRAADATATVKKGEAAARRNYRTEVIAERLTKIPTPEGYVSREMRWGIEQEPFARAAYEMLRGILTEPGGFVVHPTIEGFGCSPDALVGLDGMAQIKCPNTSTHLEWMLAGGVPLEHTPQMLAEMACTGRQWSDFVSFDPRVPKHLQLFVVRWQRDEKLISILEDEILKFSSDIAEVMDRLPQADGVPF